MDAGQNLGAAYQIDINGVNQNSYGTGWEIGAHVYIPQSTYGAGGASTGGYFWMGGSPLQNMARLPLNWANENEVNPPGGVYDNTVTMGSTTYPLTTAGCNAVIAAWVAAPDQWWHVIVPHGQLLPQTGVCTLLGKAGATKFMVWDTDTPLTVNQTVCSHRTMDDPGGGSPRNLGCTNDVGSMGTIEGQFTPGNNGLLFQACAVGGTGCTVAPNHYAFRNLELREQAGQNQGKVYLINLNDGDTTGLLGVNHVWFIGDYFHGDACDAQPCGSNLISAVIDWTTCSFCGVVYSYVDQIASIGNEDHIMQVTWSPGPSKFFGNWFEGSSINWLTGGATVTVQPYENVYDAEIRENRFTKPAAWMTIPTTGTGSVALNLKSDFECKTCTRLLIDGNIFEYSSTNGAQKGQCMTLTPRNTSAGSGGDNYGNAVQDITITNNICRHAVTGIETSGRSDGVADGGGAAQPSRRWNVQNNLFYDISPGTATIFNNTATEPFVTEVGVGSGVNSWTCGASRDVTGTVATLTCADGGTGYHETTMSPGDLVHVTSCSDTTFNTPTRDSGAYASEGPTAMLGTMPTGLTVVYPNTGTANASTTGCVVSNEQGFPQAYTFRHNSVFGAFVGSAGGAGVLPSCLNIDTYALNATFQDNLIALPASYIGTLCQGDGNTEGTTSEKDMYDPATLTFKFNALAARSASAYTDYPGAVTPSTGNFFPANVGCTGATANSSCFGFAGMMNGAAYEASAANYHDYELVSSSLFKAGSTWQADDGSDDGAQIPAIDAAQARFTYSCAIPCGVGPVAKPPQIEILAPGAGASVPAVNTYLKTSPYINAIVYPLWWACSDEDGTSAHYSWANFDNQVSSDGWATAGKKIIVVLGGVTYGGTDSVCYGGGGWGTTGVGNYATPSYVWTALGAANYVTCAGSGGAQQIPNYLNAAYVTNYQNWVAATLAHLASSSYASAIEYVRVAWGKGGETTPFSSWDAAGTCPDTNGNNTLTTDWGYTLTGWESFLQNGMTFEAGLGSGLQLMISITPMGPSGGSQAAVPNFTAPIAASLHIGFGTQGLMASDVNNFYGCGGNWCQLFATYGGQVPLETQTFYQSCPETNESGTCPSMAVTTGPLDPLLTWAGLSHATTFEMYYEDACSMLCPGFSMSGYASYPQAGYLAAMANAVGGSF